MAWLLDPGNAEVVGFAELDSNVVCDDRAAEQKMDNRRHAPGNRDRAAPHKTPVARLSDNCRQHNGNLEFRSTPKGTFFEVTLPLNANLATT